MRFELDAVRAKSVGFENLRSGPQILLMHLSHQRRAAEIELVKAAVEEDTLGVELCTHGAVAYDDSVIQVLQKRFQHAEMLSHQDISLREGMGD